MSHPTCTIYKEFMTPLLRHCSAQALKGLRRLASATALTLGLVAMSSTAHAMRTPEALPTLKGLTEAIDFADSVRDRLVQAGLDAIGTPYAWGGDAPEDGFDCSGLVSFVYREIASLELPRRASEQRAEGKKVSRPELEPGDLVFFATTRRRNVVSHVGIYIGDNQFVHAPSRGSKVRVDSLESTYWSQRYSGARAYVAPEESKIAPTLVAHQQ